MEMMPSPGAEGNTRFITDEEHFSRVLKLACGAKRSLWLGTADIKDLYVDGDKPFLSVLAKLLTRGVEVRLIHAKEPGPNFRADFDRYPTLAARLERVLCPRVHFKIIVVDSALCYVGSANLTGAGMGMKSPKRRNFEAGVLSDSPALVEAAIETFDKVWRGSECAHCGRREHCPDPISAHC